MKNIILALFSIITILSQSNTLKAHPIHITITNISINNDSIKVVIRFLKSDITDAIIYENNLTDLALSETDKNNDILIEKYIQNHLKITFKNRIKLAYTKSLFDSSSVIIFLDAKINNSLKNLSVENTLLSNIHGDQRNMVIVSHNKYEIGFTFSSTEIIKEFIIK